MEMLTHDILIVGGGGAGLRAAIAVAETHPSLNVAVVSKVYPMRSHTVAAEGGAAGVIKSNDSLDDHAYDTISGGDWLPDQDAVEAFVREAPQELVQMEHWGCPWSRLADGSVAESPSARAVSTRGTISRWLPSIRRSAMASKVAVMLRSWNRLNPAVSQCALGLCRSNPQ